MSVVDTLVNKGQLQNSCNPDWPSLFKDAHSFVKTCDKCQRKRNIKSKNEMTLNSILEVELFDLWGIDFMGPFPLQFGNK